MMKKFIAVSIKGNEYAFDNSRMIAVPKASADKICNVLNEVKYKIKKDNEIWAVHDNDWYYNEFITEEIKKYGKNIRVYSYL